MGSGFEVKDDVLNRLARDLQNVTDLMGQAMDALDRAGSGSLGSSSLDDAAASFKSDWSYGLGKLKDDLKDTTQGIVTTAKQYDDADSQIAKALDQYRLPA